MKFMTVPYAFAICIFIINSAQCQDKDENERKLSELLRGLNDLRDAEITNPKEDEVEAEVEGEVEEDDSDTKDSNVNDLTEKEMEDARGLRWYRRRVCFRMQIRGRRPRVCVKLRIPYRLKRV